MLADKLLIWLGKTPDAYRGSEWPTIVADLFFISIPYLFIILAVIPFAWLWYKKRKFTWRTAGKALLQSIGLIILGVLALIWLFAYAQGQIFQAIYS